VKACSVTFVHNLFKNEATIVKVGERKMKEKAFIGIVFATLLIASTFTALTTKAAFKGTITIGIIGPVGLPHWEPSGMKPAAEMYRDEINAAGGVPLADGNYQIVLKFGDEHAYPSPDPAAAASEVERLITVEGCEYIIGAFRSEVTSAMVEMAMDYKTPLFIDGASTDIFMTPVNKSNPTSYERYKYLFRVMPVNSTTLFKTIAAATQYLVGSRLLSLYGQKLWPEAPNAQVKVAVVMEDLLWTQSMYAACTIPAYYSAYLGKYVNVTYKARIPDGTTDCTSWLQQVKDSGARLLIHVFSGVTGPAFIRQWRSMNVSALPLGINVMGQTKEYWTDNAGACEYEAMLNTLGTRTPLVPGVTDVFWDKFVNKTGTWPIYTGLGAYAAMDILVNGLKGIGTKGIGTYDNLVAYYENPAWEFTPGLTGLKFKFDGTHDVYSTEYGLNWTGTYARSHVTQWQAGRSEVVVPVNQIYSKKWAIPPWMYPLKTDINYDGKTNIMDISVAAKAYATKPGDPRWDKEADVDFNGQINIVDLAKIAKDFGKQITLPLP
jgi:ABC-type branched-subunit amino acid transport system substrate-binding protein